jgi:hypothetical protein
MQALSPRVSARSLTLDGLFESDLNCPEDEFNIPASSDPVATATQPSFLRPRPASNGPALLLADAMERASLVRNMLFLYGRDDRSSLTAIALGNGDVIHGEITPPHENQQEQKYRTQ